MSVLIRGMKMPTSCSRCALFDEGSNGDPDWCNVMHQVPEYGTCPLVEIPPHGDLIERDAIPFVESENGCQDDYAFRYDINEMPVIIPAEEGE